MNVSSRPSPPERPESGHKGTFGRVLIIGGSLGMSGSISLAGAAALRSGAGLVYLGVPRSIVGIVAAFEPSYITVPLPDQESGVLSKSALPNLMDHAEGKDVIALGPGLTQSSETDEIVTAMYQSCSQPMVIDADGLNALARFPEQLSEHNGPRVLTPHPGEFARLTGQSIDSIQNDRQDVATRFAKEHDLTLVLKGPATIVTDGDQVYVNSTGNSGMGTGGTGDVLTGIVSALIGQKMPPFSAARFGVYLHGLAGDLAANELTEPALIASDLLRFLPAAWKQVI
ncbi:Bifunctional NAD(P)H-hydrate repair enzyme Nnr [Thalassoglobus neptunius]|uniref:ADP-dependent (S)-NAD(P)H-hydrate dehydratase n=1 Tax=Thalassoglobus neptunius TaxID=1938619 RepID=A0A5C5VPV4_9PLAN|nr:NAD(P)H-hydrate dehydratase [Thalassoglobus neptunius]TWT39831.1 Bifunctional NAD(P)H-hydrate repair enzyme Nnr [Thalassoglobus neptunius]